MTPTETVNYLKYLGSLFPTFQWQAETPAAWHNAGLCFVSPDDAKAAAQALVRRAAFIALADVLTEVRRIRDERGARQQLPAPPNPDDTIAYRAELHANIRRLGDGHHIDTPRALPAGQRRTGPPPRAFLEARGLTPDEERARAVPCPWEACKAQPHTSCTNALRKPLARSHQARHDLANATGPADTPA